MVGLARLILPTCGVEPRLTRARDTPDIRKVHIQWKTKV
jgi:hypothetical protein